MRANGRPGGSSTVRAYKDEGLSRWRQALSIRGRRGVLGARAGQVAAHPEDVGDEPDAVAEVDLVDVAVGGAGPRGQAMLVDAGWQVVGGVAVAIASPRRTRSGAFQM